MKLYAVAVAAAFACAAQPVPTKPGGDTPRESMAGAWDATLSLAQPYQISLQSPAARQICGSIGFVDDSHPTEVGFDSAPSLGVYDLDLKQFGLSWVGDASFPSAAVTRIDQSSADRQSPARDSVRIVLNPGSRERIVLSGRRDASGIDGDWIAQSARGTASGSFSLRPHEESRASPCHAPAY
jgi:hypothetical protein